MPEVYLNPRVVVSKDVCHGKPRIKGTRIKVHQVLDLLAAGKSMDMIMSEDYFPDIDLEDIQACIAYASQIVHDDVIIPTG